MSLLCNKETCFIQMQQQISLMLKICLLNKIIEEESKCLIYRLLVTAINRKICFVSDLHLSLFVSQKIIATMYIIYIFKGLHGYTIQCISGSWHGVGIGSLYHSFLLL